MRLAAAAADQQAPQPWGAVDSVAARPTSCSPILPPVQLKFNPDDLFSSLVVEPSDPAAAMLNGSSNGSSSSNVIGAQTF